MQWTTVGPATDVVLQLREGVYQVAELVIDGTKYKKNAQSLTDNMTFDHVFSKRKTSKEKWYIVEINDIGRHDEVIDFNGSVLSSFRY
jgi:hypothetical protein